jgi:hypothetical protein
MSESESRPDAAEQWAEFAEEMNEQVLGAVEANADARARFVESWLDAVEGTQANATARAADGLDGYADAYERWVDATEQQLDRVTEAIEGEDVSVEDFRDIWLTTANRAFADVMGTSAFAAATGETVDDALDVQRETDEAAEETLHALGFATEGDVQEVGSRLVELERRQHAVEEKLDEVLAALDATEGRES